MVDDFLREILPRFVDHHGAEVEKWLEVEVSRLIGWLVCQNWQWRLWGQLHVSLLPEDRASPAAESVTYGTTSTRIIGLSRALELTELAHSTRVSVGRVYLEERPYPTAPRPSDATATARTPSAPDSLKFAVSRVGGVPECNT